MVLRDDEVVWSKSSGLSADFLKGFLECRLHHTFNESITLNMAKDSSKTSQKNVKVFIEGILSLQPIPVCQ